MIKVLYEDTELIVVRKPVGMESQSSRSFSPDMVSEIKRHIHNISPKSGEPYVGVIHRLDKPVSGVMVYGKTKEAAADLSRQVAKGEINKQYYAVLCGKPVDNVDKYVDYLLKEEGQNISKVVDKGITGAKRASLEYEILETIEVEPYGLLSLAKIQLHTGRHHQIRVQMKTHGLPLWGDNKYNPMFVNKTSGSGSGQARGGKNVNVALSACELTFLHPKTKQSMTFFHKPEGGVFQRFECVGIADSSSGLVDISERSPV